MNRLKELREMSGISPEALAKRIGTSGTQIRRLEAGQRKLTTEWIELLAVGLGCSPSDLIVNAITTLNRDEVVPADIDIESLKTAIARNGLTVYRVVSSSLSEIGITAGLLITVDQSAEAIAGIGDGDVVLVQLACPSIKILRQFLRPRLLVTNADSGANTTLRTNDRSISLQILGVVVRE